MLEFKGIMLLLCEIIFVILYIFLSGNKSSKIFQSTRFIDFYFFILILLVLFHNNLQHAVHSVVGHLHLHYAFRMLMPSKDKDKKCCMYEGMNKGFKIVIRKRRRKNKIIKSRQLEMFRFVLIKHLKLFMVSYFKRYLNYGSSFWLQK